MAAHITYPPKGSDPVVRGDAETFILRIRYKGVDQDISTWTWRSYVRSSWDQDPPVSVCADFQVTTPDALPEVFTEPGATPCVLLVNWAPEQTHLWAKGFVADVEQLTPNKRTWLLIDALVIDKDASYSDVLP